MTNEIERMRHKKQTEEFEHYMAKIEAMLDDAHEMGQIGSRLCPDCNGERGNRCIMCLGAGQQLLVYGMPMLEPLEPTLRLMLDQRPELWEGFTDRANE